MNNPFTLSFGKKPLQYISRISQTNQILETFRSDVPSTQIFMITGVRGSGKTVMMTSIAAFFTAAEPVIFATGSSVKVFHSWQAGHCPCHFADS